MLQQRICKHTLCRRLLEIRVILMLRYWLLRFYLPINSWLMLPDNHNTKPQVTTLCLTHTQTYIQTHTKPPSNFRQNLECQDEKGGLGYRRRKKEDNERNAGGVKSHHCSMLPDTAGLQSWGTLIHHYRFTISFSWPQPPSRQHTSAGIPQL